MGDTDKIVYSPFVGFDNIVQTKDDGVFKPHVLLKAPAPAGFIPINTFKDSDEYKIVPGGTGRKGNMKTVLFFAPIDDIGDDVALKIQVFVQIPNGLQGLVDPRIADPTADPDAIIDPTLFSPIVSLVPAWNSLLAEGENANLPPGTVLQAGPADAAYVAAVDAAKAEAAGTIANAGVNGYLRLDVEVTPPSGGKIDEFQTFQLVVDFSHSITN